MKPWKHMMHPEVEVIILLFSSLIAYAVDMMLQSAGVILYGITLHAYLWTFVPVWVGLWLVVRFIAYRKRGW